MVAVVVMSTISVKAGEVAEVRLVMEGVKAGAVEASLDVDTEVQSVLE